MAAVVRLLRKLTGALLLAVLAVPAVAAVCAAGAHCGVAPSQHECCEGARLTDCDCWNSVHPANDDSEPAQRLSPATPALAVANGAPIASRIEGAAARRLDDFVPPPGSSDRLSLLSILIV